MAGQHEAPPADDRVGPASPGAADAGAAGQRLRRLQRGRQEGLPRTDARVPGPRRPAHRRRLKRAGPASGPCRPAGTAWRSRPCIGRRGGWCRRRSSSRLLRCRSGAGAGDAHACGPSPGAAEASGSPGGRRDGPATAGAAAHAHSEPTRRRMKRWVRTRGPPGRRRRAVRGDSPRPQPPARPGPRGLPGADPPAPARRAPSARLSDR